MPAIIVVPKKKPSKKQATKKNGRTDKAPTIPKMRDGMKTRTGLVKKSKWV